MTAKYGRREFVRKTAALGASLALGKTALAALGSERPGAGAQGTPVDVAVAIGDDYGKAAARAVQMLGGMRVFVGRGAKVAVLANVQSRHPGSYTKGEILRAVLRLAREAGAAEVACLSWQPLKQWEDTGLAGVVREEGAGLKIAARDEALFKPVPVPDGRTLTEARILTALDDYDVFINMPVTKDHAGNKFTGTMKNLMGLNSPANNRLFHKPNWQTDPADIAHLDQCIVDLNKAVKPALNVVDAAEFIITNGPFGPGELLKPRKVVAGIDRVAVDAYCCGLWGLRPDEIVMIARGAAQGLGRMDPGRVRIEEENV